MNNKEWRLEPHTYPIADTGDYDGYWELTNGDIELITKDDNLGDEEGQALLKVLNDTDCEWEDWTVSNLQFELEMEKKLSIAWKQMATELYNVLKGLKITVRNNEQEIMIKGIEATERYNELLNNLP